eukprot:512315-Prorocentrum_minimum.AAC.1
MVSLLGFYSCTAESEFVAWEYFIRQACPPDWSVVRIYPRFLRLIGLPSGDATREAACSHRSRCIPIGEGCFHTRMR